MPFSVRAVTSPGDRRTFYRIEGGQAMTRKDYRKALELYRNMEAVSAPGSDREAAAGVGEALLHLRRFREAIEALSRALPPGGTDSFIPQNLALAYIAAGDERNAEATLRRYYPVEQLQPMIAQLKAQAARLHR